MFNPLGRGSAQRLGPGSGFASPFLKLKRPELLVKAEVAALEIFRTVAPIRGLLICPQVHVLQIFDFDEANFAAHVDAIVKSQYISPAYAPKVPHLLKSWSTNRAYRSVDFLFCDPVSTKVLFGIEIDDPSHKDANRKEADEIKDLIFASVGLPLYRFTNAQVFNLQAQPFNSLQTGWDSLLADSANAWDARQAYFFRPPPPIGAPV